MLGEMTSICLEDFSSTLFIKVKWKRVAFLIVVRISLQEHAHVRRHCVINMRMAPVILSARQQPPDRKCGRTGVLGTLCIVSDAAVIYAFARRCLFFNNWSPHSVFKDKERKLLTKQLLNARRLRKFSGMFTEKYCLQHKSRKLVNCRFKVFEAHSIQSSKTYNFLVFHVVVMSPLISGPPNCAGNEQPQTGD